MANNKTNLGGAISALGTALVGIGVPTQLAQFASGTPTSPKLVTLMWYISIAGFVLSAVGKSIHAFYTPDTQTVTDLSNRVEQTVQAVITGNTMSLKKTDVVVQTPPQPPQKT